jgi:uncharacterized protein (DUF433 family)
MDRITSDDDVLGGEPRIDGTRIGVRHVAARVVDSEQSPAHVADQLDVSLADVYAALSYYYANIDEIRGFEAENKASFGRVREARETDTEELPGIHAGDHEPGEVLARVRAIREGRTHSSDEGTESNSEVPEGVLGGIEDHEKGNTASEDDLEEILARRPETETTDAVPIDHGLGEPTADRTPISEMSDEEIEELHPASDDGEISKDE